MSHKWSTRFVDSFAINWYVLKEESLNVDDNFKILQYARRRFNLLLREEYKRTLSVVQPDSNLIVRAIVRCKLLIDSKFVIVFYEKFIKSMIKFWVSEEHYPFPFISKKPLNINNKKLISAYSSSIQYTHFNDSKELPTSTKWGIVIPCEKDVCKFVE